MAKPGPAPGTGGRPRTKTPKARPGDSRKRVTVGPPGKGTQTYEYRAEMGLKKGDPMTVDHKRPISRGGTDAKSNLQLVSRAENARLEDKRNAAARRRKK